MARGKPGRAPGFKMPDEHRTKIKISQILSYLQQHMAGTREMGPTQVQAANILLKKVMPDLAAVQHSGEGGGPMTVEFITVLEEKK